MVFVNAIGAEGYDRVNLTVRRLFIRDERLLTFAFCDSSVTTATT